MDDRRRQFLGFTGPSADPFLPGGEPVDPHHPFTFSYPDPSQLSLGYSNAPVAAPLQHSYDGLNIHEGFIPSNANEFDEDKYAFPGFAQSSDEEDDYSEEDQQSVLDERDLRAIDDANNNTVDPDYDSQASGKEVSAEEDASEASLSDDGDARGSKRGRGARGRGRGRARGRGARGAASSRGRRGRAGRPRTRGGLSRIEEDAKRRGRRAAPAGPQAPPEYVEAHGKAFNAMMNGEFEQALELGQEAVRIAPSMVAAHSLLSEVYEKQGKLKDSIETLLNGAQMTRNAGLFEHLIDRISENEELWPVQEVKQKKLDCYNNIVRIDKANYDARAEKLRMEIDMGQIVHAYKTSKYMLALQPKDVETLGELAELCADPAIAESKERARRTRRVVQCFDNSFEHFMKEDDPESSELDWDLLIVYEELVRMSDEQPADSLRKLKLYSRWLAGRSDEEYWDEQTDDREWDDEDDPRRLQVEDFNPGRHDQSTYGIALPMELRIRMGVFRLRMGKESHDEALNHLKDLFADKVSTTHIFRVHYNACLEAANALLEQYLFNDALQCFEHLQSVTDENEFDEEVYLGRFMCYRALHLEEAMAKIVEHLLQFDIENAKLGAMTAKYLHDVGREEESEAHAKVLVLTKGADVALRAEGVAIPKLPRNARRYAGQRRRYIKRAKRAPPVRNPITIPDELLETMGLESGEAITWDAEKYHKLGRFLSRFGPDQHHRLEEARQRDIMIRELAQHLEVLTKLLDAGNDEVANDYMELGKIMVHEFSSCKAFFPTKDRRAAFSGYSVSRNANIDDAALELAELANRLAIEEGTSIDDIGATPDSFHGVKFEDWLEVFCRYSFLVSRTGKTGDCWEALSTAKNANVFLANREYMRKLLMCWLACGIQLNDEQHICQASRLLMKHLPFATETYSVFGFANRQYSGVYNFYNGGPWQKFLLRTIKMMDFALLSVTERRQYQFNTQDQLSFSSGADDGNPYQIKNHDPNLFCAYAHSLMMNGSYYTAMNYYFRAYAMIPEDPIVNLCIGLCFIQNGLKSKVENRQYQLQQGIAFLFRYYDIRMKSDRVIHKQEAEYNVGRTWHMLGLTHLAIPCYENVLKMSGEVRKEQEKIAREKANAPEEEDDEEDDDDVLGFGVEDFATEAAFATKMILALNEEYDVARKVAERWLVIE